jgi:hypothetical protein
METIAAAAETLPTAYFQTLAAQPGFALDTATFELAIS